MARPSYPEQEREVGEGVGGGDSWTKRRGGAKSWADERARACNRTPATRGHGFSPYKHGCNARRERMNNCSKKQLRRSMRRCRAAWRWLLARWSHSCFARPGLTSDRMQPLRAVGAASTLRKLAGCSACAGPVPAHCSTFSMHARRCTSRTAGSVSSGTGRGPRPRSARVSRRCVRRPHTPVVVRRWCWWPKAAWVRRRRPRRRREATSWCASRTASRRRRCARWQLSTA